jgi:hypothetical protein
MRTRELFRAHLPPYLLAHMVEHGNETVFPYRAIPAVIEASRAAGLINVGGDLMLLSPRLWESLVIGVNTGSEKLRGLPLQERIDQSASIALRQFLDLGSEAELLADAAIGTRRPHLAEEADVWRKLHFGWLVSQP